MIPKDNWSAIMGVADLDDAIRRNLNKIPDAISQITYLPSGSLLPSTLTALYRNTALSWIDSQGRTRPLAAGQRLAGSDSTGSAKKGGMRLLLADFANSAEEVQRVREWLRGIEEPGTSLIGAVISSPDAETELDVALARSTGPTILASRLLHNEGLELTAVSFEGIIAPAGNWRLQARSGVSQPLTCPSAKIGLLVSRRPERHRAAVIEWLRRHGVLYNELAMSGALSRGGWVNAKSLGRLMESYSRAGISYVLEQDRVRASIVANATQLPTVSWAEQRTVRSGTAPAMGRTIALRIGGGRRA